MKDGDYSQEPSGWRPISLQHSALERLLAAVLVVGLAVASVERASAHDTYLFVVGLGTLALVLPAAWRTFTRKMSLSDTGVLFRNWFPKLKSVDFEKICAVTYYRDSALKIESDSGEVFSIPSRLQHMDDFVDTLLAMVSQRRDLHVAGDIKVLARES